MIDLVKTLCRIGPTQVLQYDQWAKQVAAYNNHPHIGVGVYMGESIGIITYADVNVEKIRHLIPAK